MEHLLNLAPCLYFSTADNGSIGEVNNFLCTCLQYSREELVGKKVDLIFTLATRIFQQTHLFPLLKMQGYAAEIYITLRRRDGEDLPVLVNAKRSADTENGVNHFAGIIVQHRKHFEDELIAAKKAAEPALRKNTVLQAAKKELQRHSELLDSQMTRLNKQNEELRQFNRIVTHDMQEPLRKLALFTNLLLEDDRKEEPNKNLKKIGRITEQMKTLLSGLQQFIWITENPPKRVPVELSSLVIKVYEQLQDEWPGIQINMRTEGLKTISADYEQLYLLFHQLLTNAVQFRREGQEAVVQIAAETIQMNQFRSVKDKYRYVDFLRIRLQDEGIGFAPEYKEQVFELFRRLHNSNGRGVGLSLCKKIVEAHGGRIAIDSVKGAGTTVTILLPDSAEDNDTHNLQTKTDFISNANQ